MTISALQGVAETLFVKIYFEIKVRPKNKVSSQSDFKLHVIFLNETSSKPHCYFDHASIKNFFIKALQALLKEFDG